MRKCTAIALAAFCSASLAFPLSGCCLGAENKSGSAVPSASASSPALPETPAPAKPSETEIGDGGNGEDEEWARTIAEFALQERIAELGALAGHGGECAIRYAGTDALGSGDEIWVLEVGFGNYTGFSPEERYAVSASAVYMETPDGWEWMDLTSTVARLS
jgi:hypothetical protein